MSSNSISVAHNSAEKPPVFLDDVSDMTFVTTQVQRELGVVGIETYFDLSTILGSERLTVNKVDGLVEQRLERHTEVDLPKSYIRETIPSRPDQIPRPDIVKNWPHLKRIQDRIPLYEENVDIGLLITCNCPRAIQPPEVIRGKSEEPYAVHTLLGWSGIGPDMTSRTPLDECIPGSTYHRILTKEDVPGTLDSCLNFIFDGKTKEVINPAAFNQLLELNFTEHKNILKHGLSKEDRKFLEIAEQGVHRR